MNCRKFEKLIYLYDELNDSERMAMDDHRDQCVACGQLADQFFRTQELYKISQSVKPEPLHPMLLTNQIMKQIERGNEYSFMDVLINYFDSLFARYALSTLAIFLIIFFLYEQKDSMATTSVKITTTEINKGIILDLSKFNTAYLKQREIRQANHVPRYTYYKSEKAQKNF